MTKQQQIERYLQRHRSIDQWQAYRLCNTMRLAHFINRARKRMNIKTVLRHAEDTGVLYAHKYILQ